MDLKEDQVAAYLRDHRDFIRQWLEHNADKGLLEAVQQKWAQEKDVLVEDEDSKSSPVVVPKVTVALDLKSLNDKYNKAIRKSQTSDNEDSEEDPDDTFQ